jgi:hypothetical protein
MGHLCNTDLVRALDDISTDERRNLLTDLCSARLAHTVTSYTNQLLNSSFVNRARYINSLRRAIRHMIARLKAPKKEFYAKDEPQPYPNSMVRGQKLVRLNVKQQLLARLVAEVKAERASKTLSGSKRRSRLHIVRGGHPLWEMRHNLDAAGLTESEWRELWDAKRMFIRAIGSKDEGCGNATIQVNPDKGTCRLLLPTALRHLSNTPDGKHYILDATVEFHNRVQEWRGRLSKSPTSRGVMAAITYTVTYHPEHKRRWYIDASWAYKEDEKVASIGAVVFTGTTTAVSTAATATPTTPAIHAPTNSRILAVDLNADHIAAWVIDEHGNPVGQPYRIPLYLKGLSHSKREGHVRWAISQMIHIAIDQHCRFIACEDLGWADETGRDEYIQGPAFRRTISGFPTLIFKKNLSSMARRSHLSIVAVDPAYTSQWGEEFWQKPQLLPNYIETTGHEAAAIVIGRRSQGYSAKRAARTTLRDEIDLAEITPAAGRVDLTWIVAIDRGIGACAPMAESG